MHTGRLARSNPLHTGHTRRSGFSKRSDWIRFAHPWSTLHVRRDPFKLRVLDIFITFIETNKKIFFFFSRKKIKRPGPFSLNRFEKIDLRMRTRSDKKECPDFWWRTLIIGFPNLKRKKSRFGSVIILKRIVKNTPRCWIESIMGTSRTDTIKSVLPSMKHNKYTAYNFPRLLPFRNQKLICANASVPN